MSNWLLILEGMGNIMALQDSQVFQDNIIYFCLVGFFKILLIASV